MENKELSLEVLNDKYNAVLEDVNNLKILETKLDKLADITLEIKESVVSSNQKIMKQEIALEEILVGADFRKRESENSVREIKTQMNDMELNSVISNKDMVEKIIAAIKNSDVYYDQISKKIDNTLNYKLDEFQKKLRFQNFLIFIIGLISIFSLTISLLYYFS